MTGRLRVYWLAPENLYLAWRGRGFGPEAPAGGAAGGGAGLEGGAHQGALALPGHEADLRPGFFRGEEAQSLQSQPWSISWVPSMHRIFDLTVNSIGFEISSPFM